MTTVVFNKSRTKYKLLSDVSFTTADKALAKMKDTENGYIFKFPSWTSTEQDKYVCLDYDEAYDLWQILNAHYEFKSPT
jgi:hypothetical protein